MTADRDELFNRVADAHAIYKARIAEEKALLDRRVKPSLEALSIVMHLAHAKGLRKGDVRRAVKTYGNSESFDRLWNAYYNLDHGE